MLVPLRSICLDITNSCFSEHRYLYNLMILSANFLLLSKMTLSVFILFDINHILFIHITSRILTVKVWKYYIPNKKIFFILHSSFFIFILHSSFFILHSSFFILHSSFFILHSSFFILHLNIVTFPMTTFSFPPLGLYCTRQTYTPPVRPSPSQPRVMSSVRKTRLPQRL